MCMCLNVSINVQGMGLLVKALALEVQGFGSPEDMALANEGFETAGRLSIIGARKMTLELTPTDFLTICNGLKHHADALLGKSGKEERTAGKVEGRHLCCRLADALERLPNGSPIGEKKKLEEALQEARQAFFCMGEDTMLAN